MEMELQSPKAPKLKRNDNYDMMMIGCVEEDSNGWAVKVSLDFIYFINFILILFYFILSYCTYSISIWGKSNIKEGEVR